MYSSMKEKDAKHSEKENYTCFQLILRVFESLRKVKIWIVKLKVRTFNPFGGDSEVINETLKLFNQTL